MASTGANSAWPGHQPPDQHFSNMNPIGDQDFSTLLDLDSFDSFDFLNFDPNNTENGQRGQSVGLDMSLLATAGQTDQNGQSGNAPGPNMFDFQSQMSFEGGQGYQQNGGQHMHQMVPPTPNSVEMHGDATRYLQQMDAQSRAILEHRYQISKEAVSIFSLYLLPILVHFTHCGFRSDSPFEMFEYVKNASKFESLDLGLWTKNIMRYRNDSYQKSSSRKTNA